MRKSNIFKENKLSIKMPRRASLFWDVNPNTVDSKKHARYIIERILEFGRDDEVRRMRETYSTSLAHDVVNKSRVLRPQTKVLWEELTL